MCETLGALCSRFISRKAVQSNSTDEANTSTRMDVDDDDDDSNEPNTFQILLPRLLKKLESTVSSKHGKEQTQFVETLSAVCLQAMLASFMPSNILNTFEKVLNAANNWTQYRIARSASRYFHFYFVL